jgi:hypothetical protein
VWLKEILSAKFVAEIPFGSTDAAIGKRILHFVQDDTSTFL